jgi:hypothetical protein
MKRLTQKLLEGESKYDQLIALVDSNEAAAQCLDDITYTIAGILNGGVNMLVESDTYYRHYSDALTFLRSVSDGVIGHFVSLLRAVRAPVNEYRRIFSRREEDYYEEDIPEGFTEAADALENWLYNNANLEALSTALMEFYEGRERKPI